MSLPDRRSDRALALGVPALMVLAACTSFEDDALDAGGGRTASGADSAPAADVPCDPTTPFGQPAVVGGLTNIMATAVDGVRLSSDYRTAYFQAMGRPDSVGYYDIYTATRPDAVGDFGGVAPIHGSQIESDQDDSYPTVTGDGLTLVFARQQPADVQQHLYYAYRPDTMSPFTFVGAASDVAEGGASYDLTPFFREDGQVLYFASTQGSSSSTDIFRADWTGHGHGPAQPVAEIDTPTFNELAPVVTSDDLVIYFASDRHDGGSLGQQDIWMATRSSTADPFSAPVDVAEVNSADYDVPTFVTRDRCALYFASTRSGTLLPYVARRQPK
jgi:hypothetical protein